VAKSILGMIDQFGHEVEAVAGEPVRQQIMTGTESLTPKTKPEEIALWVRDAIARLDTLLGGFCPHVLERNAGPPSGSRYPRDGHHRFRRMQVQDHTLMVFSSAFRQCLL